MITGATIPTELAGAGPRTGFRYPLPGGGCVLTLASTMSRRRSVARLALRRAGDQVVVHSGCLLEVGWPSYRVQTKSTFFKAPTADCIPLEIVAAKRLPREVNANGYSKLTWFLHSWNDRLTGQ